MRLLWSSLFFFFNDTATTEIYTLSLHDALPISPGAERAVPLDGDDLAAAERGDQLYRDGGVVARDEADPQTVPAHPALDVSDLLLGDHDVRRPVGVTRQEPTGELPVSDVRGEGDHTPCHPGEILRPRRRADEGPEPGF